MFVSLVTPQGEADEWEPSTRAARHSVSVEVAPLFLANWSGRHPPTHEEGDSYFNVTSAPTRSSVGLNVQYGYRFGRHFELGGGAEYIRASPNSEHAFNLARINATSFAVWGRGRPYDVSLGGRFGFSVLGIPGASGVPSSWVPQLTNLLVLRQRLWSTGTMGVQLSASTGLHLGRLERPAGVAVPVFAEVMSLHVGLSARF